MKRYLNLAFAMAMVLVPAALGYAQEHGEHHEAGHGGWDVTSLIASFVNFFVLVSLFIFLFRDKFTSFLKERRAAIEVELNEATRLRKEAEAKHKEYSERVAQLDQELAGIKASMIAAEQKERDRLMADAEEKASRMRKEAEFIIEQQIKQLREDLTRETSEAAVVLAEQLLVKATTSFDQQRLAQEYLAALQKTSAGDKKALSQPPQSESLA